LRLVQLLKQLNRAPLLKRICFYSFCFGSFLAAVLVLTQSIFDYQSHRQEIEVCLEEMVDQRLDHLSEAVWKSDEARVELVLSSMLSICQPSKEVSTSPLFLSLIFDDGRRIHVGKTMMQGPEISLVYPISYWKGDGAQAYWLGELRLKQNLTGLYNEISWAALVNFLNHVLVIACSTFLSVVLGYQIVVRRVREFMTMVNGQDMHDSVQHMVLHEKSELSELWLSVLDLKEQLEERYQCAESTLLKCQKNLDAALKTSEVKSQFLAKMSHEFRTPMNGLLGFSTLLLESNLEDEQREYAQTIQASLESLLYIVNDVLDVSRIESGDLNITSIPYSLRSVVSGVSILLKKRAESKGLVFESRISPDIPQTLRGDPVRVRQVLINLVSNAIQHTNKGFVLINLELLKQVNGRALIRIAIEDSGSDPTEREKAYQGPVERFFSSELRGRRSLGLDICYQLVDLMGSQLCDEYRTDTGSTYWFELSLPVVKENISPNPIDLSLSKALNVLVIDSYELSRKITLELLQEWGIRFNAVSTAEEGIKVLQNQMQSDAAYNMILCDDLLQDSSGLEVCQRVHQVYSSAIQLVVLCSNPQLGDAEGFFLAGASGFLSKQFRDPYLRAVMCQAYAERGRHGQEKRLVTRYTVSDASQDDVSSSLLTISSKAHVLVVEDNIVNQQLVTRMLEKNACQVDIASNGFEAIELFKQNSYDLIFMDCLMPDIDGYETTQIIREIERSNSKRSRTPIVALTAQAMEGEADRCFQVGMDEFMSKPFKLAQLEMVLDRYIN